MRIVLFKKEITKLGVTKKYSISILVNWRGFNLSLKMPNMTINASIKDAIFSLMDAYSYEQTSRDVLKQNIKDLRKWKTN